KKLNIEIKEINKDSDFVKELIDDIKNSDIVLDSILGIGLNRIIEGVIYKVIESINTYSKYVISVDIPSGIDSNSGEVLGIAIKA
ncbi:NAD(P)H-hydrate epimerase, partial [Clostridioides difficile]|uniref:NAD(P)H-hydrate epimerase n=1 Tax=Clostridioides difficile TaxID=1496 RepID=UPI00210A116A